MISLFAGRQFSPLDLPNKWAWYRQSLGITGPLNVSQWDDAYGLGHNLVQASGAAQPISLPYAGSKYLWVPGVTGNNASTPDASALDITGDITLVARIARPTATGLIITKDDSTGSPVNRSYDLYIDSSGLLHLFWTTLGTNASFIDKQSTAAVGVAVGSEIHVAAALDVDNGAGGNDCKFFTSSDGISWTQLGTTVTTAGTTSIFSGNNPVRIGQNGAGSSDSPFIGKIYRGQIYNGIPAAFGGAGGALVADFNPALAADDATSFVAATGETWTINQSGAKRAQIVGSSSILFDGVTHFMKATATLGKPASVFLFGRLPTWTIGKAVFDGITAGVMQVFTSNSSPNVSLFTGSAFAENTGWAVGTHAMFSAVYNGASSFSQINVLTPVTGDQGSAAGGNGLTLGATTIPSAFSNIQIREAIVLSGALDAAAIAKLYRYGQRTGLCA